MTGNIRRRDLLGGVPLAALGLSARSGGSGGSYKVRWYPFPDHPESDTCWSASVGPDGRIYAASCCEHTPGGTVYIYRYNEKTDALDKLFELDKAVDDPRDSGRATQCKIHYAFVPSMSDGVLYMATHLSGAPVDLPVYSPWYFWHDEKRCFRGSALVAYDTRRDQVLWWDTMIPKEGSRCLLFDEERGVLYATSYPRDHLFLYDVRKRKRRDLGRIGSINSPALLLDRKHRVWASSDYGHLVRYTPETDRIEFSPVKLPYNPEYQTGWHSVFYDACASPDGECVYASTWSPNPYLMRIWLNEGEWPRVENLGPATQKRDLTLPESMFRDHCAGFVFAGDGQLYYVASRWRDPVYNPMTDSRREIEGVLWRLNPATLEREPVGLLEHPDPKETAQYVSRGAVDHNGDLFFGHVGAAPSGIFKVEMPADRKRKNAHLPIRIWG
jgi:hypothetical protein